MTGHHTTIRSRRPRSRWRRIAALGTVLAALFGSSVAAALPAVAANPSYVPISGSGSTWSFNAIDAWRKNVVQYAMTINYAQQGSTAGRNAFKSGTVDWAASDIPYGVQDGTNYDPPPDTRPFVYMPDTAGGTTFMYNLAIAGHRVTNLRLSGSTIAGIFTGTITNWSDQAIKQDNPGLTLPAIQIVPVVRSDGSGATAQFTQWLVATQGPLWNAYCAKVQRNPCTQTSAYPVSPGMVGQSGDLGVSGYVAQTGAAGAIGYVEYSYALNAGFPVAKVLNKAGYYTEPTPGHVAVSLLDAQINMNPDPKVYLTQNLSGVYTDPDARTYPLSSYSYMILPTTSVDKFNAVKGLTLGDFGKYLLCQGQNQVDQLGYSALPINLVQAGFSQLRKIPGANISNINIQSCNNPTFSTNGTNTLAVNDPLPAACDKAGPTQCTAGTGGAHGTSTPVNPGAGGSGGAGAGGAGAGAGAGTGAGAGAGATSAGAAASQAN
ncbi:MAG TPA: phosphate ABC transporter substrate-binding protein PstS, partial [Pseudonocardiaceae bacterium]|nr:phosphate ABC transporter substrate-binding protein PstS [Pseudonocardiaceae bacterium]